VVDGRAEFMMFTLWDSLAAVKASVGDEYENAVFYSDDERFLVERDLSSTRYEVDTHVQPADPLSAKRSNLDSLGQAIPLAPASGFTRASELPSCRSLPELRQTG
jgi:hypothetical protein